MGGPWTYRSPHDITEEEMQAECEQCGGHEARDCDSGCVYYLTAQRLYVPKDSTRPTPSPRVGSNRLLT